MKPYKRISNAALTLLVAGALTTGGIVMEPSNASSVQISSMGAPSNNTTSTNVIGDKDAAREKFVDNEK